MSKQCPSSRTILKSPDIMTKLTDLNYRFNLDFILVSRKVFLQFKK